MRLHGIHHLTAITGDREQCIEFYGRVLGLAQLPDAEGPRGRVLRFGDELGRPGSTLCFIEHPGERRGRPGAGMVHLIRWRVADLEVLDFWSRRLNAAGVVARYDDPSLGRALLRFSDPEGLEHELVPVGPDREALVARSADLSRTAPYAVSTEFTPTAASPSPPPTFWRAASASTRSTRRRSQSPASGAARTTCSTTLPGSGGWQARGPLTTSPGGGSGGTIASGGSG